MNILNILIIESYYYEFSLNADIKKNNRYIYMWASKFNIVQQCAQSSDCDIVNDTNARQEIAGVVYYFKYNNPSTHKSAERDSTCVPTYQEPLLTWSAERESRTRTYKQNNLHSILITYCKQKYHYIFGTELLIKTVLQ